MGAVFATASKSDAGDPIGPQGLSEIVQAVKHLDMDVVAIGGISADNASLCFDAGAQGLSLIHI